MKLLPTLILSAALAALAGCASNYKQPQTANSGPVVISLPGSQELIFKKAVAALLAEGFSIASSDPSLGVISTQRRQMALTKLDVDVGSTWGIDYMKDKRTTVFVTMTIEAAKDRAAIRSDIDAEYLPNDPVYGKRMKGVSRGTLEQKIAERMQGGGLTENR